jgi:hypothetical protein
LGYVVFLAIGLLSHCRAVDGSARVPDKNQTIRLALSGSVTECEVEFTEAAAEQLKRINTPAALERAVFAHFGTWSSNAVVRLLGQGMKLETRTDEWGNFEFGNLQPGDYEVSVEKKRDILGRGGVSFTAKEKVKLGTRHAHLEMTLGERQRMAVKGKVVDAEGKSVAGARVTGYGVPRPEQGAERTFKAVTDKDGNYDLKDIPQPSVWAAGGWLNGGDPTVGQNPFYFEIYAENDSGKGICPRMPLVSKSLLEQAQRFHGAMNAVQARWGKGSQHLSNKTKDELPKSSGNTIFAPDIVIKKTAE